jgi:hypothetical protein
MLSNKAIAIVDPDIRESIKDYKFNIDRVVLPSQFVKSHRKWLVNNTFYINGLENFEYAYIVDGVTGAFNDVYHEDVYVLDGEYSYHKDIGKRIEHFENIPAGSRLIISYPFAATGNIHKDWKQILENCKKNNIHIFVDACLAGVSLGVLDVNHPAITHVAFSFSKAFGTGFCRTGVLYARYNHGSPASITNKYLYLNHNNIFLHTHLMNNFESDYIFKKYRFKQIDICKKHSLLQSDCVLFGLDNNERKCVTRLIVV